MFWWKRKTFGPEFPKGFSVDRIRGAAGKFVADLTANEIAAYFQQHPEAAMEVLSESYDKRYSPSTFISEEAGGFVVGWYSLNKGKECVRTFDHLHEAATDYVLFSLGKGRWTPPQT